MYGRTIKVRMDNYPIRTLTTVLECLASKPKYGLLQALISLWNISRLYLTITFIVSLQLLAVILMM